MIVFVSVCLCTLLKNILSNTVGIGTKSLNNEPNTSVPDPDP